MSLSHDADRSPAQGADLAGKIALVTGASRGIGRAIARQLAARGAILAVHYNQAQADADRLVDEIEGSGGEAFALAADLSQAAGAEQLANALGNTLQTRYGSNTFDILVNNAGVGLRARIGDVKAADFDRVFQVNFKTPFFLIQHLLPRLRDGGRIINVSSIGTRAAYPEMSVYAPSKAALESLTLLLAAELGARGITVNAVLPGATATDLNARARDPEMARAIAATVALGRVGQPDDIAGIVAFLAGDGGRWVTGQRIDASGGQRL
ncbi:SDR family oxidoreductase [Alcaligenaceae bacterium C4P045]|nr:SDR family oxidoreductase [Alcaligenaceae bacterium C4P045]